MRRFLKFMSLSLVSMSILISIQNILQDYLEIRNGEYKEEEEMD